MIINDWCKKYNVNMASWKSATKARSQMIKILLKGKYELKNAYSLSFEQASFLIRRLMFQGFASNCAKLEIDSIFDYGFVTLN